ncbi:MAG: TonB-dependent receptor [Filimonas sp.]|nr:TonB-dependent receptor [Filimonas sp.]
MKMISGVIAAIFLLFQQAYALPNPKFILSGKILEAKSNSPLPGATIYIPELKTGAISDEKGSFRTGNLPAGKYLVEISYQGYASVVETVQLNKDVELNVSLQQSVLEQEAVIVTGVSSATRIKQSPQPIVVVKHDELFQIPSANLIDALSHVVPGVANVATGPAISKPVIRGLGYNRVVVVNDGIRQEGQQWGDEHGIEIDDYSAQRVEVLKGPASLMYGSDAMAGVMNIQSFVPAPEGTLNVNVLGEYQSNSRLRGTYANVSGTKNGFNWNVYGSYKGAEDYSNKYDGRVFNSKFYNKNVGGMLGYNGAWGYSHLIVTNFDQHIGMVEGERDSATGKFTKDNADGTTSIATDNDFNKIKPLVPFQHIQHFKALLDNSFKVGANKLDVTIGFQHNQRREFGNAADLQTPDAYFNLKTFNYGVKYHLANMGNWKTSFGVTGMYQTNENLAAEAIIPDYNLYDIGGFAFTQYSKDHLTVSGGVRFDNRSVKGKAMEDNGQVKFTAFDRNFSNISGSVGLSYEVSKQTTLKLNVARGFRAPNMAELASNGAHEGTNRFEKGDNNLKSETSFQLDGGVEWNSTHVSLSASAFFNSISNFIFYEKVLNSAGTDSIINDGGNALTVYKFDQRNATLYGGELSIDIHPHPLDWLHFQNTIAYTQAQFSAAVDGTKNLPLIPAARLLSELKGQFLTKGKTIRNLSVHFESDYNFKQNRAFTGFDTETPTDSYWLINAGVSTDVVSKGKKLFSLSFMANNITDVAYQNHLSRLKYLDVNNVTGRMGVFNMGRNFTIKVNVPLSFKI